MVVYPSWQLPKIRSTVRNHVENDMEIHVENYARKNVEIDVEIDVKIDVEVGVEDRSKSSIHKAEGKSRVWGVRGDGVQHDSG